MEFEIFDYHDIRPLAKYGLTGNFWTINLMTIIYTWAAMATIAVLVGLTLYFIRKPENRFIFALKTVVDFLANLTTETLGFFDEQIFYFTSGIFLFTLSCNLVSLIPYIDEPTKDLNTTLAIGAASFIFVQYQGFKKMGLKHINEYMEPVFFLLPLNIISELAKIASMGFRLFGNILGGSIIMMLVMVIMETLRGHFMMYALITIVLSFVFYKYFNTSKYSKFNKLVVTATAILVIFPCLQIFFVLMEGLIQAFVVAILTLTYTSLVIKNEDEVSVEGVGK